MSSTADPARFICLDNSEFPGSWAVKGKRGQWWINAGTEKSVCRAQQQAVLSRQRIHFHTSWVVGLPSPATAHGGKPLGSCQSGARQQRLQILVGRSWDEAGTRIIPWTLDPAGLGAQCGARAQQLQTSRGAGGSCWGKFQKRFSVQMLSVLIHPSLPGLWELCGCILGCLAIV